ncbi:hypothetical protein AVEN_16586-1 [Araneus ventricosus]|uniref:Uncharacterized protein n=1 Tax=Araneus ventricosus TaxID=182803 RepID=A0A4Y2JQ88_ARAVE|nr:hypothetical protein AVEN_16586-1 [Araneus ventricosus]
MESIAPFKKGGITSSSLPKLAPDILSSIYSSIANNFKVMISSSQFTCQKGGNFQVLECGKTMYNCLHTGCFGADFVILYRGKMKTTPKMVFLHLNFHNILVEGSPHLDSWYLYHSSPTRKEGILTSQNRENDV